MRLVGATDGFIRRPFLIEGSIKGVLGGVLALVLTYLAMRVLEQYLHFETVFFDRRLAMLGILFGALMGLLGSAVSVGQASAAGMSQLARRGRYASSSLLVGTARARCAAPCRFTPQDARLRAQRDTLDRIRREREDLERRAAELQNSVHDLDEEVTNLDRRADATARLVKALDAQLATITTKSTPRRRKVAETEDELDAKKTALHRRLVDIYKRGPLFSDGSDAVGAVVRRARRAIQVSASPRRCTIAALVDRVEQLRDEIQRERDQLVALQTALEENRSDKEREEARLRALEHERSGEPRADEAAGEADARIASRASRRPRRS